MIPTIQELAADLAQVFPERFVWFPDDNMLRLVFGDPKSPTPLCTDAYLDYFMHHGMVFTVLSNECERRGWYCEHRRESYRDTTHYSQVSPDWDRTEFVGRGGSFTWSFAKALIKCGQGWKQDVTEAQP